MNSIENIHDSQLLFVDLKLTSQYKRLELGVGGVYNYDDSGLFPKNIDGIIKILNPRTINVDFDGFDFESKIGIFEISVNKLANSLIIKLWPSGEIKIFVSDIESDVMLEIIN